jgi:asparagine synthase (glutamine-hydrolysing)
MAFFQTGTDQSRLVNLAKEQTAIPEQITTLALGQRRLAIIDLSQNGAQPMSTAEECLWIIYNGEIYNYIELREELAGLAYPFRSASDTEVILAAYAEWGEECVQRFNGAITDLRKNRLFCSRDRFGVKPFHYFHDGTCFVFGSEIKQLFSYSFVPRQVNQRAVYGYLAFDAVDYCEETFFTSLYKLMQGHNLVLDFVAGKIIKPKKIKIARQE